MLCDKTSHRSLATAAAKAAAVVTAAVAVSGLAVTSAHAADGTTATETVIVPANTTGYQIPRLACPTAFPFLLNVQRSPGQDVVNGVEVTPPTGVSAHLHHTTFQNADHWGLFASGLEGPTQVDTRNTIDNVTGTDQTVRITLHCTNSFASAVPESES
jgi:hypothetical protein